MTDPVVRQAADVTEDILRAAEEIHDGWYGHENGNGNLPRIDWDDFLLRLENHCDIDLTTNMQTPAVKKIQAYIRGYRKS